MSDAVMLVRFGYRCCSRCRKATGAGRSQPSQRFEWESRAAWEQQ